jgi:hypothetical protein
LLKLRSPCAEASYKEKKQTAERPAQGIKVQPHSISSIDQVVRAGQWPQAAEEIGALVRA